MKPIRTPFDEDLDELSEFDELIEMREPSDMAEPSRE